MQVKQTVIQRGPPRHEVVTCPYVHYGAVRAVRGACRVAGVGYASKKIVSPAHGRVTVVAAVVHNVLHIRVLLNGHWRSVRAYKGARTNSSS